MIRPPPRSALFPYTTPFPSPDSATLASSLTLHRLVPLNTGASASAETDTTKTSLPLVVDPPSCEDTVRVRLATTGPDPSGTPTPTHPRSHRPRLPTPPRAAS